MIRFIGPIVLAIVLLPTAARSQVLTVSSDGPFATEALAVASARERAAVQLAEATRSPSREPVPSSHARRALEPGSPTEAGLVRSVRIHRQDKPYGAIFTAELMIDASPQSLERLASGWHDEEAAAEARTVVRGAALGALVVTVLLVYGVCSTLTRGWFRWPLRVAATVVSFVAAGAILA